MIFKLALCSERHRLELTEKFSVIQVKKTSRTLITDSNLTKCDVNYSFFRMYPHVIFQTAPTSHSFMAD